MTYLEVDEDPLFLGPVGDYFLSNVVVVLSGFCRIVVVVLAEP